MEKNRNFLSNDGLKISIPDSANSINDRIPVWQGDRRGCASEDNYPIPYYCY